MMKQNWVMVGLLSLLITGVPTDLHAYTYTFHNRTGHLVKVTVELYEGEDAMSEIDAHQSYTLPTALLLKSWKVEVFQGDKWETVMHNTCDMLPGNHAYFIHADEKREPNGTVVRTWGASYQ